METFGWLSNIGVGNLSAAAILAVAIYMILSGRLVPRKTVDDIRVDRDERVKDAKGQAEVWKDAYMASEQARQSLNEQVGELVDGAKTTERLLLSLAEKTGAHHG